MPGRTPGLRDRKSVLFKAKTTKSVFDTIRLANGEQPRITNDKPPGAPLPSCTSSQIIFLTDCMIDI
jgi:hypothetical protein